MTTLYYDSETFSRLPLSRGVYRYAEEGEVMLVAWAVDDGPVAAADLTDPRDELVARLTYELGAASTVIAHGAMFDRTMLRHTWRDICPPIERWHCTMAQALCHGLPGSLDTLCGLFKIPQDLAKDKRGKALIRLFCQPRSGGSRATRLTHPKEWEEFKDYAKQDVVAMRALHAKLPNWNYKGAELALWHLDQKINDRGFQIDMDLVNAAIEAVDREKKALAKRTQEITSDAVGSTTQRDVLLKYILEEQGVTLPDLTVDTVERRLEDPELPDAVKELLRIRLSASTTSTAKYAAVARSVSSDGRLRGTKQFSGAQRTRRWAGRLFQPDNQPRLDLPHEEINNGIAALKLGVADILVPDIIRLAKNAVRGVIVAKKRHKLVVADLANIEGRIVAWLAKQGWKVQAFRDYDTILGYDDKGKPIRKGADLYKLAYARAFDVPHESVTKLQRQIGKVLELMLGFQGGVGAFITGAETYGIDLDDMAEHAWPAIPEDVRTEAEEFLEWSKTRINGTFGLADKTFIVCDSLKRLWRRAHDRFPGLWGNLELAAVAAVRNPGEAFHAWRLTCIRQDNWLRIILPSGNALCYPSPSVDSETGKLSYWGIDQYTRKWKRITTYGGKLCIAAGTPVLTFAGWKPIESVTAHDRVWDGVEWVSQQGHVYNGRQKVVTAFGVQMTPEHLILTEEGWRSASQSKGHKRASCRLPDGVVLSRQRREEVFVGDALRLRGPQADGGERSRKATQQGRQCFLRVQKARDPIAQENNARDVSSPGFRGMALNARSLQASVTSCLAQLRGAWHRSLRALARGVHELLGGHGALVPRRVDFGSTGQQRGLHPGELPLGYAQGAGEQHPQIAEVFDLVNCGPRHRFVILAEGAPLIVHNCENATQSLARDVLATGLVRAEAAGYPVVLHVHDEIVCEVPDTSDYSSAELARLMSIVPDWAEGLPLAAAGFETDRYTKE
jgi:DNA polymerase